MENNKFNRHYSKKSVTELIEELRFHRINVNLTDKVWFEALRVHLSERDISTEERQAVNHILSEVFDKELESLNKQKKEFEKGQKIKNHSNLLINPTDIISAGRNIKNIASVVLVMIFLVVIAIITAFISKNPDTIKYAYLLLGASSLICNLIILFQLYSAGDYLENSVYKKEE